MFGTEDGVKAEMVGLIQHKEGARLIANAFRVVDSMWKRNGLPLA